MLLFAHTKLFVSSPGIKINNISETFNEFPFWKITGKSLQMHFFQTGGLNDLRQSTYVIDADKLLLKKFSLRLLNIDLQIYKNLVFMHTR